MQETTLIEQDQPVGAILSPVPAPSSDHDSVLLRHQAEPGKNWPGWQRRRPQQPTNPFRTLPWSRS